MSTFGRVITLLSASAACMLPGTSGSADDAANGDAFDGSDATATHAPPLEAAPGPAAREASPPRGSQEWPRACSTRHRFCVRGASGIAAATTEAVLESADGAWETLVDSIGAPAPVGPAGDPWTIYVVDTIEPGSSDALFLARESLSAFDSGSSFALVGGQTTGRCALASSIAYAIARGSSWRTAPAADEGTARAAAAMLSELATPCAPSDDVERASQSHPDRCIVASNGPLDRGAPLFFRWVDETFGREPGALVEGLFALSPTHTPEATWAQGRWARTPTAFDVLRVSLRNVLWNGSTLEDVFVRFAVARALQANVPPALAWHIPWPARPRRLASPVPVAPTGASYVAIDRTGARPGARLRLELQWEDYARMRWVAVKMDASGHVLAELPVRSLDRSTHAAMSIDGLDDVDRVLVVGVNVGDTERAFDPDQGEWEPHGWLLTAASE